MEPIPSAPARPKLWTRDFTIITVGTVVSMLGSTLSSFAMSLMVLDYTGSTLLFAIYNILYMLPNALAPVLVGPFLDRFSRKKTIYTLDFMTAGLFAVLAVLLLTGRFHFYILAATNFLLGTIGGIYMVAYDSFYPLLITEGNYNKAYSVSSTLETLTMVMVPLSTLIYKTFGIVPLFLADTASYLAAAILETQIRTREEYIGERAAEAQTETGLRRFTADFRAGLRYLSREKGLLAVTIYFIFSFVCAGATGAVTLPYFRSTFENGEYVFMLTWGMSAVARCIGGVIHYRLRLPPRWKFTIALGVYIALSVLEGTYLFVPVPLMMVMCGCTGILGVTSYTIRISATQKYVPDGMKGRFNGAFNTLTMAGMVLGEAVSGGLSTVVSERAIVVGACAMCLAAALVFIGGRKDAISKVYNTEA